MPIPPTQPPCTASRLRLGDEVRLEIGQRAAAGYPLEVCGVLVGSTAGGEAVVRRVFAAANLEEETPGSRYRLDPRAHLAAWRWARAQELDVVGFWHSHPDGPARPSRTDRRLGWEGYLYLIVPVTPEGVGKIRGWYLRRGNFVQAEILE